MSGQKSVSVVTLTELKSLGVVQPGSTAGSFLLSFYRSMG